ncbi:MAG TPA: phytanoyl-CoA dioxygenase family protein [Vicinamibacteria bacterium]|nr:phytanoyl-CoA dioxygenase family protein [Vicinamibacteria bacterium]
MTIAVPATQARRLDEDGYVRLEGFIAPDRHRRLVERIDALFAAEGDTAGAEFRQEPGARRLANLADKGAVFLDCVVDETVGAYLAHVLGPRFKLSSLNARSANPHSAESQPLHVDAGALPDEGGYWVCNTVWLLDDFTTENGALRVVPGTHRSGQRPQDVLADPEATHPEEVLVTGRAGDLVVMNSHLWHGGTANRTDRRRLALHGFYCRWDKPQQQYQKALLRPETVAALSPAARAMLALDDPANDALSAEGGRSGFMK